MEREWDIRQSTKLCCEIFFSPDIVARRRKERKTKKCTSCEGSRVKSPLQLSLDFQTLSCWRLHSRWSSRLYVEYICLCSSNGGNIHRRYLKYESRNPHHSCLSSNLRDRKGSQDVSFVERGVMSSSVEFLLVYTYVSGLICINIMRATIFRCDASHLIECFLSQANQK